MLYLLADPNQVEQILASVEEVTRTYFGGNDDTELRPKDGVTANSAFDPDESAPQTSIFRAEAYSAAAIPSA